MADEVKNLLDCNDIWYAVVFGVAEYESELNLQKFKMADDNGKMT